MKHTGQVKKLIWIRITPTADQFRLIITVKIVLSYTVVQLRLIKIILLVLGGSGDDLFVILSSNSTLLFLQTTMKMDVHIIGFQFSPERFLVAKI